MSVIIASLLKKILYLIQYLVHEVLNVDLMAEQIKMSLHLRLQFASCYADSVYNALASSDLTLVKTIKLLVSMANLAIG